MSKKRALVTGGTKGIGLGIAQRLRTEGHEVVVTYAHDEAAADAARAAGLVAVRCDVADEAATDDLFKSQAGFEIVVHSAGFTRDKLMMMMPAADFDAVLGVHLRGGFLAARRAVRHMIGEKWGRIVFIVSPTALLGRAGQTNYGAAKAGLIGMSRSLAREMARFSVTVNCLCVGYVETEMTAQLPEKAKAELLGAIPLGRPGTVEEVAHAAAWLCSSGASYVTGQVLGIDGGLT